MCLYYIYIYTLTEFTGPFSAEEPLEQRSHAQGKLGGAGGIKEWFEVKGYWSGDGFQVFVSLNYLYSPEPIVVPNFFLPPPGVGGLPADVVHFCSFAYPPQQIR